MKKTIFSTLLLLTLTGSVNAQLTRDLSSFSPLKSPNQQIIEQVVNSGVFILKQSYELADSLDNRYGLSGNKAFDIDYTLAIKIKNGILVTERALRPWDYNPEFDQYRKSYTPKLFPTYYSEVSNNCRYDSLFISEMAMDTVFSGLLYAQESEQFFGDGFSLGGRIGDNEGWIVWFSKKKASDLGKDTNLNLSIIQKKVKIISNENGMYFYPINPLQTSEELLGGIFVIPEVTSVGHMELKLCGVVCHIDNGWMLCCPFVNKNKIFQSKDDESTLGCDSNTKDQKLTLNPKENSKEKKSSSKKDKSKKKRK